MIYLSGPMSGLPELNRPAFYAAAATLQAKGLKVFNPAVIRLRPEASWADYMHEAIAGMMACDSLLMLPDWEKSRGAMVEHWLARACEMPIYYSIESIKGTI